MVVYKPVLFLQRVAMGREPGVPPEGAHSSFVASQSRNKTCFAGLKTVKSNKRQVFVGVPVVGGGWCLQCAHTYCKSCDRVVDGPGLLRRY